VYDYDIIVVGWGHAGCEAALAAARMGANVLLTGSGWETIADMPCNPSLGGPGKAQIIREIDALGGEMAKIIDHTYLQIRLLNTGKGPAVHSLWAQADKKAYTAQMRKSLEIQPNLTLRVSHVERILINNEKEIDGIETEAGEAYRAPIIILATGTYLGGTIYIGHESYSSGPYGQPASVGLSKILGGLGFNLVRFKTGTSPRIARHSINYARTKEQPGHELPFGFSFETPGTRKNQLLCHLTYTTPETHNIIRTNLSAAPLYTGAITGPGPRYCPSIETKVMEFPDRDRHQIFLEPETRDGETVYLGGLSTSLPPDIQTELVHSVPGLEEAEIIRPGYAIEYDCLVPTEIYPWLEVKRIPGLFTAGQINGTSGYEEAASQGLMAGINAVLKLRGQEPFVLQRSQAYIGVLIDDLVTKGTQEPYRMMTSRVEYRLTIRQDNADLRLTDKGFDFGLIPEKRYQMFKEKRMKIQNELTRLKTTLVPGDKNTAKLLEKMGTTPIQTQTSLADLLLRPEVDYETLGIVDKNRNELPRDVLLVVEIESKYAGYIKKQMTQIERARRLETRRIPRDIDYSQVYGLSREAVEKLSEVQPDSLGRAARISGVSPADIATLIVHLETGNRKRKQDNGDNDET
jgi:tRNA uridine 5-carboxymethylaminomethyl modification enzyme